jgi:hypothetical protein
MGASATLDTYPLGGCDFAKSHSVTLNLFQGPLIHCCSEHAAQLTLKQVQGDDLTGGSRSPQRLFAGVGSV